MANTTLKDAPLADKAHMTLEIINRLPAPTRGSILPLVRRFADAQELSRILDHLRTRNLIHIHNRLVVGPQRRRMVEVIVPVRHEDDAFEELI